MQIEEKKVVTLNYTLKNDEGEVIDASNDGSFAYLHGANNIIPGLENALVGKAADDELSVSIEPAEGYGERNPEMVQVVDRNMFNEGDEINVGMQFHAQSPDGQMIIVTIADIDGDQITIDGNHPLAGVNLNFDVKVVEVRDATEEELDHGHVHGPGDHHH